MSEVFLGHWVPAHLPSFLCSSQLQHFKQLLISAWWIAQISRLQLLLLLPSNHLQSLQTPSRAPQLHIFTFHLGQACASLAGNCFSGYWQYFHEMILWCERFPQCSTGSPTAAVVKCLGNTRNGTFVMLLLWCSPGDSYVQLSCFPPCDVVCPPRNHLGISLPKSGTVSS